MQTLAKVDFFVGLSNTIKPLHHELEWAYHAEFLGKLKNFTPLCLLDDEHTFCFSSIYLARNNTKIITQSQYTLSFLTFYRPSLGYTERCLTCHNKNMISIKYG
jgi:hypothetical protein